MHVFLLATYFTNNYLNKKITISNDVKVTEGGWSGQDAILEVEEAKHPSDN